jgi:protein-tyrosine phosphatase/arsenate reductase
MYPSVRNFLKTIEQEFEYISSERKELLAKISDFMQQRYDNQQAINLIYVCTHNSRRSHFGQVAAAIAAAYYNIDQVKTFSGGTEATAFNPNAIKALKSLGFDITTENQTVANPIYAVSFGQNISTTCFSKVYNHEENITDDAAAIMTCSDAEQNCPLISGVSLRIGTTYEDPKKSDGTVLQDQTYSERFKQIATETLYAFSLIR